jgi:protein-L-isoaspartate(D-aspartate) O-methyltransferase
VDHLNGNSSQTDTSSVEINAARHAMVETQLRHRGINDDRVLAAMDTVPRHEFVPPEFRNRAYEDAPLPIGEGQTISQPYIVAAMTQALRLSSDDRVLEVGTGCGYQAAVLASLAKEVFTIEYHAQLASESAARLSHLGYMNVHVHCGDGTLGLRQFAPFNAILVAAAAPAVPAPLLAQVDEGGRMILPVGDLEHQQLQLIERHHDRFLVARLEPCRFVRLVGAHGWEESSSQ